MGSCEPGGRTENAAYPSHPYKGVSWEQELNNIDFIITDSKSRGKEQGGAAAYPSHPSIIVFYKKSFCDTISKMKLYLLSAFVILSACSAQKGNVGIATDESQREIADCGGFNFDNPMANSEKFMEKCLNSPIDGIKTQQVASGIYLGYIELGHGEIQKANVHIKKALDIAKVDCDGHTLDDRSEFDNFCYKYGISNYADSYSEKLPDKFNSRADLYGIMNLLVQNITPD